MLRRGYVARDIRTFQEFQAVYDKMLRDKAPGRNKRMAPYVNFFVDGRVVRLDANTKVAKLGAKDSYLHVRVEEGKHKGREGYAPTTDYTRSP